MKPAKGWDMKMIGKQWSVVGSQDVLGRVKRRQKGRWRWWEPKGVVYDLVWQVKWKVEGKEGVDEEDWGKSVKGEERKRKKKKGH
jgi:hypothetical protein